MSLRRGRPGDVPELVRGRPLQTSATECGECGSPVPDADAVWVGTEGPYCSSDCAPAELDYEEAS